MSHPPFPPARTLRCTASRLALAATLLAGVAAQACAEEPRLAAPAQAGMPQMRGLGVLQDRTALATLTGPRAVPAGVAVAEAAASQDDGLPEEVKSAYACLIGGSTALAASFLVGGENLTNLIAGGVVVPQNQAVLYIALVGVVFVAFCTVTQSLLPIYTYHFDTPPERPPARPGTASFTREAALPVSVAPERVTFQAGVLGGAATGASRRMGATAFAGLQQPAPGDQPVLVAQER
jgi:hypothetical protein